MLIFVSSPLKLVGNYNCEALQMSYNLYFYRETNKSIHYHEIRHFSILCDRLIEIIMALIKLFCSFQTHPNIDKKLFTASSIIGLKNPEKPFPMGQEVGVLKWRFQTTDESYMPLSSKSLEW